MRTFPLQPDMLQGRALFSNNEVYRYSLHRVWRREGPLHAWIGINPSTATGNMDDPTIRRCIGFSRAWGASGIVMLNLFAWRATDPKALRELNRDGAVGPQNMEVILDQLRKAERVICAWGNGGVLHGRGCYIHDRLCVEGVEMHCLGFTRHHQPKHPLYLAQDTPLIPFA